MPDPTQAFSAKIAHYEQIGNDHIGSDLLQKTTSWLGRAVSNVFAKSSNNQTVSNLVKMIKNTPGFGDKYAQMAKARLESAVDSGKPLTGRVAAKVLREIRLAKTEQMVQKTNIDYNIENAFKENRAHFEHQLDQIISGKFHDQAGTHFSDEDKQEIIDKIKQEIKSSFQSRSPDLEEMKTRFTRSTEQKCDAKLKYLFNKMLYNVFDDSEPVINDRLEELDIGSGPAEDLMSHIKKVITTETMNQRHRGLSITEDKITSILSEYAELILNDIEEFKSNPGKYFSDAESMAPEDLDQKILMLVKSGIDPEKIQTAREGLIQKNSGLVKKGIDPVLFGNRLTVQEKNILKNAGFNISAKEHANLNLLNAENKATALSLLTGATGKQTAMTLLDKSSLIDSTKKEYIKQGLQRGIPLATVAFSDEDLKVLAQYDFDLSGHGELDLLDDDQILEVRANTDVSVYNILKKKQETATEERKKTIGEEFDSIFPAENTTFKDLLVSGTKQHALTDIGINLEDPELLNLNLSDPDYDTKFQAVIDKQISGICEKAAAIIESKAGEIKTALERKDFTIEEIFSQDVGFSAEETWDLINAGIGLKSTKTLMSESNMRKISIMIAEGSKNNAVDLIKAQMRKGGFASDTQTLNRLSEMVADRLVPQLRSGNSLIINGEEYKRVGPAGSGTESFVHRFQNVRTGKNIAVKLLKSETDDAKANKRIESTIKELRNHTEALGEEGHKNIIGLSGVAKRINSTGEEEYAVIMEYAGAGDLSNEFDPENKSKRLTDIEQKKEVMLGVVSGLSHLHSRGQLHGDLKPDNIMLSRPEDKFISKLIDFGRVKDLEHPEDEDIDGAWGTLGYAAPEAVADVLTENGGNFSNLSAKSDIFSLGVIMFQAFNGGPIPFKSSTLAEYTAAMKTHLEKYNASPENTPTVWDSDEPMAKLINQMLHPIQEKRPPLDVIEQVLNGNDGALTDFTAGLK